MTYEQLVDIFKAAVATYNATVPPPPKDLNFYYDYVWYNNGAAANKYPSMLFECSPDFEINGLQSNGNPGLQTFSGKLFFYDTYEEKEKATEVVDGHIVESWRKQSRLNEVAVKVIGGINKGITSANGRNLQWGKGFLAKGVHNPDLIQVTIDFKATLKVACAV